ncbi:MAG: MGMT family protein [Candidatus Paceibacterota bacterium]
MKNKTVFKLIATIPKGKVTTYKLLAQAAGISNPRTVGQIIHHNLHPEKYPCHRVVKSDGSLATGYAFGGAAAQKSKLTKEGMAFLNNRINLKTFLFTP